MKVDHKYWRNMIVGTAWLLLTLFLYIQAHHHKHVAPPQPVAIQLDTWSLRTGDALDPAKRCEPPALIDGHWFPMVCPDNEHVYQ